MSKNKLTTPAQQGVLELPYEPLANIAGRKILRELATVGRQTAYIDIDFIVVRGSYEMNQGFNPRFKPAGMTMEEWEEKLEIPELAMDMLENGQADALEGDMLEDGTFVLTDGFRRKLGIQWLLKKGHTHYLNTPAGKEPRSIRKVEIFPNPSHWTEEDRLVRALSSNNNLKYEPIEIALKLKLWKDVFGRTNDELGKRLGKSRQYVDNMLKLAEEPESIQEAIASGAVTHTAVLKLRENEKDPEKREEIVQNAIKSGEGLSVKDAAEHKNEWNDYKERINAIKEQYKDGVITHSKAATDMKEIAIKAAEAKADAKSSIDFALKTGLAWLDEAVPDTQQKADWANWSDKLDHLLDMGKKPKEYTAETADPIEWRETVLATLLDYRNKAIKFYPEQRPQIIEKYDAIAGEIEQLIANDEEIDGMQQASFKQYDYAMADIALNVQDDVIPADQGILRLQEIRTGAVKLFPEKTEHIDFCLLRYHQCIKDYQGTGNPNDNESLWADYGKEMKNIVSEIKNNPTAPMAGDYGITRCRITHVKAARFFPEKLTDIDNALTSAMTEILQATTTKVESKAAVKQEEESRKTSAKQETYRPQNQKNDALAPIDFSQDKALGEMELNEATKMLDKLHKNIGSLPDHMKQYKNDWQGLVFLVQQKIDKAREIIKKAGDTR